MLPDGVAADAIVVGAAAVELAVPRVLSRQLHIEPGQVIDLRHPAACIGRAAGAGDDSGVAGCSRRIKAAIGTARGREVLHGTAQAATIVVGSPKPRGREVVRWIGGSTGGVAGIQSLGLVNMGARHCDLVLVGHVLVLQVFGYIVEAVLRPG